VVKPVLIVQPFRDYLLNLKAYYSVVRHLGEVSIKPMSQQSITALSTSAISRSGPCDIVAAYAG